MTHILRSQRHLLTGHLNALIDWTRDIHMEGLPLNFSIATVETTHKTPLIGAFAESRIADESNFTVWESMESLYQDLASLSYNILLLQPNQAIQMYKMSVFSIVLAHFFPHLH